MALKSDLPYTIKVENDLNVSGYDGIVFISATKGQDGPTNFIKAISKAVELDQVVDKEGAVLEIDLPAKRLIYIPVNVNLDCDDVRSFGENAKKGLIRALKAGVKKPLIMLPTFTAFPYCQLVSLLGVLEALYVNLQYRESKPNVCPKLQEVGLFSSKPKEFEKLLNTAVALEHGRWVARDIGGSDPERMAPPKVEQYVREVFANSPIKMQIISDTKTLEKDFPLFSAVNRAANEIERHRGRILILTYESAAPEQTLFLVGKGVTYDTGGADVKAGGIMAGMSRDKCGAAAVAGFMKFLAEYKPKNIKVVGIMAMVRNSIGENSYVADEIIMSRSGARVRVGNTDAEGRMIMADTLCYAKELAAKEKNPHLMTIATLTGHAYLAVGKGYATVMDNAVACQQENAIHMYKFSQQIGDPFEMSTIRRDDYMFHRGKVEGEDILQANNQPSSRTARGHQGPSAFLILASGLDKYGMSSEKPLKYSHLDIAGSAGDVPDDPSGSPILALYSKFLNEHLKNLKDA